MTPGQAKEMMTRIEQKSNDRIRAQAELDGKRVEAILNAIGQLGKAVVSLHNTIASQPTVRL